MTETTNPPTIPQLAEALRAAGPRLDEAGRRVAIATYRLLARGEPVADSDVADTTGLPHSEVARRLAEWPAVFRDKQGGIVGFWGLARDSLVPEYRLTVDGYEKPVHAWCAWDTLFLPAVLGRTLEVSAADGHTGEPISLTVSPDGVRRVDPDGTVVSFLVPDGPFDADVVVSFCHKVLFFTTEDHAAEWIDARPDELFTMSVNDAFEVGRLVVEGRYADTLGDQTLSAG